MGLIGNLSTMHIDELLNWIALGKRNGTLTVSDKDRTKSLSFKEGFVISAYSNCFVEQLAGMVVKLGKVDRSEIKKIPRLHRLSERQVGNLLMDKGYLSLEVLLDTMKALVEEVVYGMFSFTEGIFVFTDREIEFKKFYPVKINLQNLMLEGARRADEWKLIKELFPQKNNIIALKEDKLKEFKKDIKALSKNGRKVFDLIDGRRSIHEIVVLAEQSEFITLSILKEFLQNNLIEVIDRFSIINNFSEFERIEMQFNEALSYFNEGLLFEALKGFEEILKIAPRNPDSNEFYNRTKNMLIEIVFDRIGHGTTIVDRIDELKNCDLSEFSLTPYQLKILELIDGKKAIRDLYSGDYLDMNTVYFVIYRLLEMGLIEIKYQEKLHLIK